MTPKTTSMSVGFFSLGCAKNLVDSQLIAGHILSEGMTLAPAPEVADIVIVNTCAFIESAREESIDTILQACRLKEEGSCRIVLVAGCMAQRYKEELSDSLPEVDAFIGLDELTQVANIVKNIDDGNQKNGNVHVHDKAVELFEPHMPELVFTGAPYAYLKIAEGCNHQCSFCAIPGIRGRHRSRSIENIVNEASVLISNNIRELNLISQDTSCYGKDLKDNVNLSQLLFQLGKLDGDFRLRLLYAYPNGITDELLRAMCDIKQVCHYLDIPIQHSHPDILKAMARSETIDNVQDLTTRIRKVIPDIVLRTTCLVGFPGEEEKHFQHLLDYIENAQFDHLGVFAYSLEEGTGAFNMTNRPEDDEVAERIERLMTLQKKIVDDKSNALIGNTDNVLIDGWLTETGAFGRSYRDAPEVDGEIFVDGLGDDAIGKFVKIKYIKQCDYDMQAVVYNG